MRLIQGRRQPIGRRDVCVGDSTGTRWLDIPPGQRRLARNDWDWGEESPGCRQLAYAILYWVTGQRRFSEDFASRFAGEILTGLDKNLWTLLEENVLHWCLEALMKECGLCDGDEEGIDL